MDAAHSLQWFDRSRWLASALVLIGLAGNAHADDQEAAPRAAGRMIEIALPIQGGKADRLIAAIDRAVHQMESEQGTPTLILKISTGETEDGRGNNYHKASQLAEHLAGLQNVRIYAYLPETIKGHAVLVAMACHEIVMHPDARIGEAGLDEPDGAIRNNVRSMYKQIAEQRRTLPVPLALGMLDAELTVMEVEIGGKGIEVMLPGTLEKRRQTIGLEITRVETLIPAGEMGLIGTAKARDLGIVRLSAVDVGQLADRLDLSPGSLDAMPLEAGDLRPVVVPIEGEITIRSISALRTLIDEQIHQKKNFICLAIDSDGGSLEASIEMANYLAALPADVRTVAFVKDEAKAEAALIAMACDQLVMLPDAMLGGGPINADDESIEHAVESITTIAEKKSRAWSLMASTIREDLVVRRYHREGRRRAEYFCEDELRQRQGLEEKQNGPPWIAGDVVVNRDETLYINGTRAEELGLVRHVVESQDEFRQRYGIDSKIPEVKPGLIQDLVSALVQPGVAAILLTIGGLALYIELQSPGAGIGGFTACICYSLFFWGQYMHGTASELEIVLFVLGVLFLLLEVFILPGFGIFGLGGGAMVIASLVLASMTSNWIDSSTVAFAELRSSMSIVVGSGAGILVFGMLARRYLPHAPMFNRVMLAPPEGQELAELSDRESMVDYDHLLDQQGQTTTQLTPSGKARIGNELIDVIADGEVIELGATIEVVEVRGNRVVVRSV